MSIEKIPPDPGYPNCPLPSPRIYREGTVWLCDHCGRRYRLGWRPHYRVWNPKLWPNLFTRGKCPGAGSSPDE